MTPKDQVAALLKSIETGNPGPVAIINADSYTQHNLGVADGRAGFGALLALLPPGSARVNTVRVFQDGDYVFSHTEYDFFGPTIGFDIFRFSEGRIVEHWDNLQTTAGPNPSGHTMIDGPTVVRSRAPARPARPSFEHSSTTFWSTAVSIAWLGTSTAIGTSNTTLTLPTTSRVSDQRCRRWLIRDSR